MFILSPIIQIKLFLIKNEEYNEKSSILFKRKFYLKHLVFI